MAGRNQIGYRSMNGDRVFVDTNAYSYDANAGQKHDTARSATWTCADHVLGL